MACSSSKGAVPGRVGGTWGTLSELALAKRRGGVPAVSLGGWQLIDAKGKPVAGIEVASSQKTP